ncbi:translation initiation factor IF-1 [Candidatus Pacearchaeota archaeon]|jgi:translation initiation factor IF-1|nr:translation initiation factor IF-1 [Candidatus Pacearchaeota archaeon]
MPSEKPRFNGLINKACGNGFFSILIDLENGNTRRVMGQLSGKMRTNNIKVVEGDKVDIELDTFDITKCRIIYRKK